MILSEVLELDRGVQGTGVSVAYYFHGSECVGAAQLITVSNTFFGCRTPAISDTFDAAAKSECCKRPSRTERPSHTLRHATH